MNHIGNRADALLAFHHHSKGTELPEGWGNLGSGSYRHSYASPERGVDKVQYYSDEGYNDAGIASPERNKREPASSPQHKDAPKPAGFTLAPCRLGGRRVLAMPLISGPNGQSMGGWHAAEGGWRARRRPGAGV